MDHEAMWYELKDQLERDCKFGAGHKSRRALLLMEEYEKRAAQSADAHPDTAQQAQPATCPECGGDGEDHEDSSKDCFKCNGSGCVPGTQQA